MIKQRIDSSKPIAVVILNWNGSELLPQYLPSVIKYTDPDLADIIVADNGSTDNSLAILTQFEEHIKVISWSDNLGFAAGYNKAINLVNHPYILLLNSDIRVTPHWLSPLYQFIVTRPDVVSVQPTIRWEKEPNRFEYAGALGGYVDKLGYPFCRGRIFSTLEYDTGQYGQEPQEVFWTSGACMLVRRELYINTGGLEESFFAHQEEIDLCWRWGAQHYKLYAIPASVVYHQGGASLSVKNPRKTYLNFRNNLCMLSRNLPVTKRRKVIMVRFFLDALAAIVFLCSGNPKDAKAVFKAWKDFYKYPSPPVTTGCKDAAYKRLYPKSVLYRYYICQEKTYQQLKKKPL